MAASVLPPHSSIRLHNDFTANLLNRFKSHKVCYTQQKYSIRQRSHFTDISVKEEGKRHSPLGEVWSDPDMVCVTMECPTVPHGVEDGAILHDAEKLVGGRHVVSHRSLPVPEEGVRRPHFGDHQVVQPQNLYGSLIHQPPVHPLLPKEHVHCVLLETGTLANTRQTSIGHVGRSDTGPWLRHVQGGLVA